MGASWTILGAIWGPAGRQGAPKIDLFGTKSHQKIKEKNYREKVPPSFVRALLFGATWVILGAIWAILGAIWAPAGRQGALKINLFGTKSNRKLKK